jgi:hypothetical protein
MKNIFLILAVLIFVAGGGTWYYSSSQTAPQQNSRTTDSVSPTAPSATPPTPQPASSVAPVNKPVASTGTISGDGGYPSSCNPDMTICAIDSGDGTKKFCTEVKAGCIQEAGATEAFTLEVPVGAYYLYATTKKFSQEKLYYDKFSVCGLTRACESSTATEKVLITVSSNKTTKNIVPDWYHVQLN